MGGAEPAQPRELQADPEDPAAAKRADSVVAALFILSMLAGIGFIAAYIGLPVHISVDAVLRSNLALGISMAVAFLALGFGAVIWVRRLMPDVELTEARKPLASTPGGPEGVPGDVPRRSGSQPVRQAAHPAPDPDRRHPSAGGGADRAAA